MKAGFLILLYIFISLSTLSIFAQNSLDSHHCARLEIGVGTGLVGEGGGLSGRIAFSYIDSDWGGVLRLSAHDGGEGLRGGWFGPPKEKFYDTAIQGSYVIKQSISWQLIASAGVGALYGERLSDTKYNLEDFGRVIGFAYELCFASAGSTLGWSLNIMGNVNSESNLVALIISATIGYQK